MNLQINICRHQSGLTLIEVLVAALVLAIGLVGLAGLNLRSLQSTHSAYYSSIGSVIASDAEERLWLKLGEDGFVNTASLDAVQSELTTDWSFTGLPDLLIRVAEDTSTTPPPDWLDVIIVISWTEARFAGASAETFGFKTRIPTGITGP